MVAPMLPANAPVLASLALPDEYAVTSAAHYGVADMLARLQRRLEGGLKLIQVREPDLPDDKRSAFTQEALALAHRHGAKVLRSEEHTSELQSLRHLVCR